MKYLTARGLAYWFMDDGNKKTFYLNTHAFTPQENIILCEILNKKFSLHCCLAKNKGFSIIKIPPMDHKLFISLLNPI